MSKMKQIYAFIRYIDGARRFVKITWFKDISTGEKSSKVEDILPDAETCRQVFESPCHEIIVTK